MGTSNFHNKNASRIFSNETNTEYFKVLDDDGEEYEVLLCEEEANKILEKNPSYSIESYYDNDEFIWEDTRDNVKYELEKIAKDKKRGWWADDSLKIEGELRSFPSTSIGSYWDTFDFCGIEFKVELVPHTTSGYYSGFNLDWTIEYSCDGVYGNYDKADDFVSDVKEFIDDNKALRLNMPNLEKRLEKLTTEMVEEVESAFEIFSDKLEVFARFSNGETIYTKVA